MSEIAAPTSESRLFSRVPESGAETGIEIFSMQLRAC